MVPYRIPFLHLFNHPIDQPIATWVRNNLLYPSHTSYFTSIDQESFFLYKVMKELNPSFVQCKCTFISMNCVIMKQPIQWCHSEEERTFSDDIGVTELHKYVNKLICIKRNWSDKGTVIEFYESGYFWEPKLKSK